MMDISNEMLSQIFDIDRENFVVGVYVECRKFQLASENV